MASLRPREFRQLHNQLTLAPKQNQVALRQVRPQSESAQLTTRPYLLVSGATKCPQLQKLPAPGVELLSPMNACKTLETIHVSNQGLAHQ